MDGLSLELMQDTAFTNRMLRGDSARTLRLQAIIEKYGWPDADRFGPEAAQSAFLILQHSPVHEFQEEMVPVLEGLAVEGKAPRDGVAMLIDRVRVRAGIHPDPPGGRRAVSGFSFGAEPVDPDQAPGLSQWDGAA